MTPPILKRFLFSWQQNKLIGIAIFLLILGGGIVLALQPEPPRPKTRFRARGQLAYSNPPPLFTSTGELLAQTGRQIDFNILLSFPVQRRVQQRLQLGNREMREIIERKLKISPPRDGSSQFVNIQYNDADSEEEAVSVLGVMMNEMVEQSRLINTYQLRSRIEALENRLGEVQGELAAAEEAFYRFISTEGTSLLAVQDGSLFNGITETQQQQRQIKLILEEIEGQMDSIVEQLGLSPEQAYTVSALSADPILANLQAQVTEIKSQIRNLEKDLRPDHPNLVILGKQLDALEESSQERAMEILGTNPRYTPLPSKLRENSSFDPARQQLANNLVLLQTQKEGILRQLNSVQETERELRQQYEQFPDRQLQQARLVQEVEAKRALYQTIVSALVDAQSAEAETTGSYNVAQAPTVEKVATAFAPTNRVLILAAGTGIGLVASTGVIFLLALLDDRLHTPQELRELLVSRDVPVLGNIPHIQHFGIQGEEGAIIKDTDSSYLAFYERARSNLLRYSSPSTKVILVTSVHDKEGKSVNAYNLAITSAHAGKRTLLIEADLRSASNAHWVDLQPDIKSHHEPLKYYSQEENFDYEPEKNTIRLVPGVPNLYLVSSPGKLRQVAAIIESDELRRFIEDARGRFDVVIIDTPSLSKCNDALLLEALTDGVVLVTRPGISRGTMVGETIDQFSEIEIPVLGAIINDTEKTLPVSNMTASEDLSSKAKKVEFN
ncbi:MAG: AAA family ATPase [Xenococcaceae cyanobacterium MO_207.B15]|nr:AAA family ATPase [Xenococcaceae cyanobacterium MO_207.B15]MDJ0742890.1 AAA family ATPase [Xenococcaceae cyanobacterium MO_167.B27]